MSIFLITIVFFVIWVGLMSVLSFFIKDEKYKKEKKYLQWGVLFLFAVLFLALLVMRYYVVYRSINKFIN